MVEEGSNPKQLNMKLAFNSSNLYSQIALKQRLRRSFHLVKKNKGTYGIDGVSINWYEKDLDRNISELARLLRQERYQPLPVKRIWIPKPDGKRRPLGIPAVRDRIVQQTLLSVVEPLFDPIFADSSYGFRPGRSAIEAVNKVQQYLDEDYHWIFEADIEDFFGSVNHDRLMGKIRQRIKDRKVRRLIGKFLRAGVMEEGKVKKEISGTPQGGVISPLLANVYLNDFDHKIERAGLKLVRYADDFVILCRSENQVIFAAKMARAILNSIGLKLKPEKTRIVSYWQGFDFLGYRFQYYYGNYKWPGEKAIKVFKDKIRYLTRRQQPRNINQIVSSINPVIRGWGNYFKYGNTKRRFQQLDGWIRMRLRSFIEKRKWPSGLNWKYPNDHFRSLGLVYLYDLISFPTFGLLYRRAVCGKPARTVR